MKRFLIVFTVFLPIFVLSPFEGNTEPVSFTENDQGFLFQENGEKILFYQRAPKSFQGRYTRNNYIHPLWNLDGSIITEDAPGDHFHQRGIFWTWHQTVVGDVKCGDAWACQRFSWDVKSTRIDSLSNGAKELHVTVLWKSPDYVDNEGKPIPIVQEDTRITIHPKEENYRNIDFNIQLLALQKGAAIGGSDDDKGYGGFSLRIMMPEDLTFHSGGKTIQPENTAVKAANWMDFMATFDPSKGRSGVAVFVHPENPGDTDQWILRQRGSMQNPVFPGREKAPISQTVPLVLNYRVIVHTKDDIPLDKMYQEYAQSNRMKKNQ